MNAIAPPWTTLVDVASLAAALAAQAPRLLDARATASTALRLVDARFSLADPQSGAAQYAAGHLPGAEQLSGGRVLWNLDQLPAKDAGTIVTYCQSGVRNSVAASALRREGYDVVELKGSYLAWVAVPGNEPVVEETVLV